MGNIKSNLKNERDKEHASTHQGNRRASVRGPYYRSRGMSVNTEDDDPPLSIISQEKVPTLFTWTYGGDQVYLTGTFNDWKDKVKLVKSTHDFSIVLELPPGTHQFKFIVDDEWKCSNDMETATDQEGSLVNYIQVMNAEEDWCLESNDKEECYSNTIPRELTSEMAKRMEPPMLPPHFDKVQLDTQEDSMLCEPNHVTLNHLYACSTQDMIALGTTARYCKKYVTITYYRPLLIKQ